MASITLKNIPGDLHRQSKKRAKEHHSSLNREIIATLSSATGGPVQVDRAELQEAVRQARSLFELGGSLTRFQIQLLGLRL